MVSTEIALKSRFALILHALKSRFHCTNKFLAAVRTNVPKVVDVQQIGPPIFSAILRLFDDVSVWEQPVEQGGVEEEDDCISPSQPGY